MPNPLTKRLVFWKDIYYGWTRKGLAAFITFATIVLILRDLFVSPQHKDFSFFRYIPQWPWYAWLIAGLVGLLLLTLESSYNQSQRDRLASRAHLRTRLKDRDNRHKTELLLRAQAQGLNQHLPPPVDENLTKTDEEPQLEPDIVIETPELLTVHQRESDSVIVEGTERGREQEMMLANVVPYRNLVKAGKPIGVARNITGRAIYHRYGDTSAISKERIAWLSEDNPRVFFERNDVRRLVIALQNLNGAVRIVQREVSGTGRETRYTLLADGVYSVHVTLMNEIDSSVKNISEFILEVPHTASVTVALKEANLWRALKLRDFHDRLSMLFDSYKTQLTADDPPGAAQMLLDVIGRDMFKCKEFVAQHFGDYKSKRLGLTLAEYRDLPIVIKRLTPSRDINGQISGFLDGLNELRRKG